MTRRLLHLPTLAATVVVAVLAAVVVAPAARDADAQTPPPLPIELQYVPPDSAVFARVDVDRVWKHAIVEAVRKSDAKTFSDLVTYGKLTFGHTVDDVKSFVVFVPKVEDNPNLNGAGFVVTFHNAYDREKIKKGTETLIPKMFKVVVEPVNDRTVLVLVNLGEKYAKPQTADKNAPLMPALLEAASGKHALVAGITPASLPEFLRGDNVPNELRAIQPLFKALSVTATLDLGRSLDLNVRAKTATAGQAVDCEKAFGAVIGLIGKELAEELKDVESDKTSTLPIKDLVAVMKAAATALEKAKYSTLGNETGFSASLSGDLPFTSAWLAVREKISEASDRSESSNNLHQIALAVINYTDSNNSTLPPAAICDKRGKPLLSWRVLILPYLEQDALFKEFKLDEPWDSEHNKKLLKKMPKVYAIPGRDPACGYGYVLPRFRG